MKTYIKKYKYLIIFILIFLCYIPYLLHFFPGIIISDTYSQMKQAIGFKRIDNHHPVFQTFTWWIFINIAKIFKNDNIAVLLNSLFQMISMAGVFTYSIYILDKKQIKNKFLPIFYCVYPIYGLYSIYTTKDTMFGVAILFYIIELTKLINNPKKILNNKKDIILLLISMILVILYKNNGIYIVLITQLIVLIYFKKEYFKKLGIIFFSVICFYLLWTNVVFSIFNIKQTEKVESLSLFLNQMHYITNNVHVDLSKKLENKINEFIDIKSLKKIYISSRIDNIKPYFKTDNYKRNTLEFFKLSLNLFFEFPRESIKSFYLKNQPYFEYTKEYMVIDFYENKEGRLPLNIEYHTFNNSYVRKMYEIVNNPKRKSILITLLNSILFKASINFYCLILLCIVTIIKRKKEVVLLIPLIILWLTDFVAPAATFRYIFPSLIALPYLYYNVIN